MAQTGTGLSRSGLLVLPSFANPQGSWFKGRGSRNGSGGMASASRVAQFARRWRTPDSGGANWLGFSAGARSGILASRRRVGSFPLARSAGNRVPTPSAVWPRCGSGSTGGRSRTVSSGPWHSGLPQACWRSPTRAFGRNQRRQIAHGLFRASGMVMLHGHHAPAWTVRGSDQNAWVSLGKLGMVTSRKRRSTERSPGLHRGGRRGACCAVDGFWLMVIAAGLPSGDWCAVACHCPSVQVPAADQPTERRPDVDQEPQTKRR
jgi:hypothetical protein